MVSKNKSVKTSTSKQVKKTTEPSKVVEEPSKVVEEPSKEVEEPSSSKTGNASEVSEEKTKETDSVENVFCNKLSTFIAKISAINKEVKELQSMGKSLEKDFSGVIKAMSKQKNKNKSGEGRSLSGFAIPSLLTPELYKFLQIEEGKLVPRKDVTKLLNKYIIENNLRNDKDKRQIIPDDNLKRIFNCTDSDQVTYFNLQTYLKHHFIKQTPVRATA